MAAGYMLPRIEVVEWAAILINGPRVSDIVHAVVRRNGGREEIMCNVAYTPIRRYGKDWRRLKLRRCHRCIQTIEANAAARARHEARLIADALPFRLEIKG